MRALVFLLAAGILSAAEPAADYWKAVAQRYAAEAAFERSITMEQRQLREAAQKAEAAIKAARDKLAAACAGDLDDDLNCRPKQPAK
jgi:hypothetical protein